MLAEKTISKLQDLVRVNIDSYKGFEQAAQSIDNPVLAQLFREIATYRRAHANELTQYVESSGEDAPDDGSMRGTAHRWWLSARAELNSGDSKVVLIEAERAEDKIKERYEEAIKETIGQPVHNVLLRQFDEVKRGHDKIRDLRDAAK